MITIILGGSAGGPAMREVELELGKFAKTLDAEHAGAFDEFCRRAIASTRKLTIVNYVTEERSQKLANDDFNVFFPSAYLAKTLQEGVALLKIATAIEVALDLGLDVQVLALDRGVATEMERLWPAHWPTIRIFTARK